MESNWLKLKNLVLSTGRLAIVAVALWVSRNTYIVLGSAVVALPVALVGAVELTTSRAESFHGWSAAYGWLMPFIQVSVFPALGVLLATLALAVRHVVRRRTGSIESLEHQHAKRGGLSNR